MPLEARVEQIVKSPEFRAQNEATQKAALGKLLPDFGAQTPETQQAALDGLLAKYKPPTIADELGQGLQNLVGETAEGLTAGAYRYNNTPQEIQALESQGWIPQTGSTIGQFVGDLGGQIGFTIGGGALGGLAGAGAGALPGAIAGSAGYRGLREANAQIDRGQALNPLTIGQQAGFGALDAVLPGSAAGGALKRAATGAALNLATQGVDDLTYNALDPANAKGDLQGYATAGGFGALAGLLLGKRPNIPATARQAGSVARQGQPIGLNRLRAEAANLPDGQPQELRTTPGQNRRPIEDVAQYAREPQYRKEVNARILKQGERGAEDAPMRFEDRLDPLGEDQYIANETRAFIESLQGLDPVRRQARINAQKKLIRDDEYVRQFTPDAPKTPEVRIAEAALQALAKPENPLVKRALQNKAKSIDASAEFEKALSEIEPAPKEIKAEYRAPGKDEYARQGQNALQETARLNRERRTAQIEANRAEAENRKRQMASAKKEREGNRLLEAIASASKKKEPIATKTELKKTGPDEYARMAKQAKEETATLQKKAAKPNPLEVVREKAKADRQVEDAKSSQPLKANAEKDSPPPEPVKKAEPAKAEQNPEPVNSKTEPDAKQKVDDGTQPFDNPGNLKTKAQDSDLVGQDGLVMTLDDLKKNPKAAAKLARLDAGAKQVASTWIGQAKAGKRLEMFGYDPATGELSSEFSGVKTGQAGADGSADKTVTPLGVAHNAQNDNLYLVGYNNNFEMRTYILPEKLGDKGASVVRPIDTPGLVGELPNPYFKAGEYADPRDYVLKLFNELPKKTIDALVRSDGKIPPEMSVQIREKLSRMGEERVEAFNFVRETMGQKEQLLAAIMDADPAISKAVAYLSSGGQTSLLKAGTEIKKASPRVKALFDEVTVCG